MKTMIKQLLNSIIAKYCDLSASRRPRLADQLFATVFGFSKQLICWPLTNDHDILRQPRPVIVKNLCLIKYIFQALKNLNTRESARDSVRARDVTLLTTLS